MLATLGVLCALIWIPILFYQMNRRGFLVLICWLFIAPVASNLVNNPGANPFFETPAMRETSAPRDANKAYLDLPTNITLRELLEPTRILVGAFLMVFLLAVSCRKRLIPMDRTEIWMAAFSVILVASALLQSERVVFSLHTATDAFIVPFLGYSIARRLVKSEEQLCKLIQVMRYMGCYLIAIGLVEYGVYQMGFYRVRGPFRSVDILHIVLTAVFFMGLLDPIGTPQRQRVFPLGKRQVVTYLAPVIIFLTWARGSWLGFLFALSVFVFLVRRSIGFGHKIIAIAAAALIIAISITVMPLLSMKDLFGERVADPGNAYGRLATWKVGLEAGLEHPIFGIGLNNSRIFLAQHQIRMGDVRSYDTLHNSPLSIFVELGVTGLFAYLATVASIVRIGMNLNSKGHHVSDRWRGSAIIAIMISYQVASLFSLTLYLYQLSHIYVYVCVGAIAGLYGRHERTRVPSVTNRNPLPISGSALPV